MIRIPFATAALTSATNNSSTIGTQSFAGGTFLLNVSAVSGTTPGMTVKLQYHDPTSDTYLDIPGAAFPTITGTGLYALVVYPGTVAAANSVVNLPLNDEIRAVATLSGTSPSFTVTLGFHGVTA